MVGMSYTFALLIVLFFGGTLLLKQSRFESQLGVLFLIRTKYFLSLMDHVASFAPRLWKFLADAAVVFSFGGLGFAYVSANRRDSKSPLMILLAMGLLASVLAVLSGFISFPEGQALAYICGVFAVLSVSAFALSRLKQTSLDFLYSTGLFTIILWCIYLLTIQILSSPIKPDFASSFYIPLIAGGLGIPPLLIGIFIFQASEILLQQSDVPGVSPMIPTVNEEGDVGVGVPGYDIFIPIVHALIAFVILMFSHEFAHGVLARVYRIKVKSTGLLTLGILPVGAFVEPDEEEMSKRPGIQKMHVFAAGSFANVIVSVLCVFLWFSLPLFFISSDGLRVAGFTENSTNSGILEKGMIIKSLNGVAITDIESYRLALEGVSPGTEVEMVTNTGVYMIATTEHPNVEGYAFTGILLEGVEKSNYGIDLGILSFLRDTIGWTFFFNINIALVNILPIAPFDGWRMLRELLLIFNISEATAKRIVSAIVLFSLVLILLNVIPLFEMLFEEVAGVFS